MKHQLFASISAGSGSTFTFQLRFINSTIYFQSDICTEQTSNEFPAFANTQPLRVMLFYTLII